MTEAKDTHRDGEAPDLPREGREGPSAPRTGGVRAGDAGGGDGPGPRPADAADDHNNNSLAPPERDGATRFLPVLEWLPGYGREDFTRDAIAGTAVAVLLVPQAMAYALLADLPPQVGLFAAMAPPLLYALFGTSRFVAVGPVALVSLLVAQATATAAEATGAEPMTAALALAVLVGGLLLVAGAARLGFIARFLSEPVLTGFTAAAAVLIAASQVKHLLGTEIPRGRPLHETVEALAAKAPEAHLPTLGVGVAALALFLFARGPLVRLLLLTPVPRGWHAAIARGAPLAILAIAGGAAALLGLGERGVPLVGELPHTLPPIAAPPLDLDLYRALLPSALVIAFVAFVIAVAVGRSLAGRRRQRIDPSREMLALGAASLAASVSGGYPVGASLSRSAVNFDSGARTPIASAVTSLLVVVAALVLGDVLALLPRAVLAALILSAVFGLVDLEAVRHTFRYNVADGVSLVATFLATLALGVDQGIGLGVAVALVLYLWRTSQPRVVIEGRMGTSEQFRSVEQPGVEEAQGSPVLVLRVDGELYFANVQPFHQRVLEEVAERPEVVCLLLDLRAVDDIDASALETLEHLVSDLSEAGVAVGISEIQRPVLARLERIGFLERIGEDHVFLSTHEGVDRLCRLYPKERTRAPAAE